MSHPIEISKLIYRLRGRRVMLSVDLAKLYEVAPKVLVQAVKRNHDRFPDDFLFRLAIPEVKSMTPAGSVLPWGRHAKYPPYAFTEQGVAMLSSVLKSKKAIQANIAIMRAFVRIRELGAQNNELLKKLGALEKKVDRHDKEIGELIDAIREEVAPQVPVRRRIGFERA